MKVSIIIPFFNEEKVISGCLSSLGQQDYKGLEIIVIDDGSSDKSPDLVKNFIAASKIPVKLLRQNHRGPGAARNLGAAEASGEILVFVDADMEFEKNFVSDLVAPIVSGETKGTFSREEYLLNKDKPLARCWNLNLGRPADKMAPRDYAVAPSAARNFFKQLLEKSEGRKAQVSYNSEEQHVFRAILKKDFLKVGGFDTQVGYTDDWSLARKLGVMAKAAPGAKFYHRNPETYREVWIQARWFGKNEFLTGSVARKFYNLFRYCPLLAPFKGVYGMIKFGEPAYLPFKIVYDKAVFISIFLSFFRENKNK